MKLPALSALILVLAPSVPLFAQDDTAAKARAVLEATCFRCHGKNGSHDGRIDFMLDAGKLIASKKVVPGKPEESKLFVRMKAEESDPDTMPPEGEKPRPSKTDIAAVEKWIADGAKPFPEVKVVAEAKRERLDDKYVYTAMLNHLNKYPDDARYIRFITLQVQHNSPKIKSADLRLYRAGIAKLLNSLSWKRNLVFPKPIDAAEIVLALDLRDLDWDLNDAWRKIVGYTSDHPKEQFHPGYPYALTHDKYPADDDLNRVSGDVYRLTGSKIPAVRADWLLATASVPPLYHELLNLPTTAKELEERIRVNVAVNFQRGALARAGFEGSEVSAQANRLVERHESTFGYYYPSYDFRSGDGRGNLKQFPLGPLNLFPQGRHPFEDFAFQHDGGELIFSLPNGQQAYLLVDGKGNRINEGPADVVRDKKETAGRSTLIVNGLSCMACHIHGMIGLPKDEIRLNTRLQGDAFTRVKKLHPTTKRMEDLMKQDEEQYLESLEKIIKPFLRVGADKEKDIKLFPEPVTAIASPFLKGMVTLEDAAVELGVSKDKLQTIIENNPVLRDELGLQILANGGTLRREVWQSPKGLVSPYQGAAAELKLGTPQHIRR